MKNRQRQHGHKSCILISSLYLTLNRIGMEVKGPNTHIVTEDGDCAITIGIADGKLWGNTNEVRELMQFSGTVEEAYAYATGIDRSFKSIEHNKKWGHD